MDLTCNIEIHKRAPASSPEGRGMGNSGFHVTGMIFFFFFFFFLGGGGGGGAAAAGFLVQGLSRALGIFLDFSPHSIIPVLQPGFQNCLYAKGLLIS